MACLLCKSELGFPVAQHSLLHACMCGCGVITELSQLQHPHRFTLKEGSLGREYWGKILSSIFCLATTGTGWGSRFSGEQCSRRM